MAFGACAVSMTFSMARLSIRVFSGIAKCSSDKERSIAKTMLKTVDQGSQENNSQQDARLLEPFAYLSQQPGKEVRSQLMDAFDAWLRVPAERLAVIRRAVEMLHNASLLYARFKISGGNLLGKNRLYFILNLQNRRRRGQFAAASRAAGGAQNLRPGADDQLREFRVLSGAQGAAGAGQADAHGK